ncbi:MAG: family 10 glycosylhydrolase [Ardenticatenaceae bacterium]|nr:family 10 glycosylhydrolase [Ardenticatenaceae bacterium]
MYPLSLWCGLGGFYTYPTRQQEGEILAFIEKCAVYGVTCLFPTIVQDDYLFRYIDFGRSPVPYPALTLGDFYRDWHPLHILVTAAHERGIQVHPYLAINYHGGQWLKKDDSLVGELFPVAGCTRFAGDHPELWRRDRRGRDSFEAKGEVRLSHAFPEARAYDRAFLVDTVKTFGVDGVQLEFVSEPLDETGSAALGYDEPLLAAFTALYGQDPRNLAGDDARWVRLRAGPIATLIQELRADLQALGRSVTISVSFQARESYEYLPMLLDWPRWVEEGLIDILCLWHTSSDPEGIQASTEHVVEQVAGRCQVVAELSCYHQGAMRTSHQLASGARAALNGGATALGLYRADAVEVFGLWESLPYLHDP